MNNYYVYALFRENETPFYIGMGKGRRMHAHVPAARRGKTHKDRIINKLNRDGQRVLVVKLVDGLTREEAVSVECDLILLIGRYPNGPLSNLTAGGDGSKDMSLESRSRIGAASKGNKRALGHTKTPEGLLRISEAARNRVHSAESNAKRAFAGINRKWLEKSKVKASIARARWHAEHPEFAVRLAEANRNRSPEMKAEVVRKRKPVWTEKGRLSISLRNKGNSYAKGSIRTPEHRAAVSASNRRRNSFVQDPYLFWYSSHAVASPVLTEALGLG